MILINREIIRERYDYYVDYYNESKNPITASSDLMTIKVGLQQRLEELKGDVDLHIDHIKKYLEWIYNDSIKSNEEDKLLAKNHTELIEHVTNNIKWEIDKFSHIDRTDGFINFYAKQIRKVCNEYDKSKYEQASIDTLNEIVRFGKKYEQTYYHLRGIKSVINKIIQENYPLELKDFRDLLDQEKKEITEGYKPHHNTRENLIEDLQKILKDIRSQPRFFHKNGNIKHTTVAKYAVSLEWFAEKHGYGDRGLHEHIKKTYQNMKSNYSS